MPSAWTTLATSLTRKTVCKTGMSTALIHSLSIFSRRYCLAFALGQHSPTNSDATTAVVGTLQRNNNNNTKNNNNLNINNRQNTLNRNLEMNRNNYLNPLGSVSNGTVPGTLTLGRIKSERNNYING